MLNRESKRAKFRTSICEHDFVDCTIKDPADKRYTKKPHYIQPFNKGPKFYAMPCTKCGAFGWVELSN